MLLTQGLPDLFGARPLPLFVGGIWGDGEVGWWLAGAAFAAANLVCIVRLARIEWRHRLTEVRFPLFLMMVAIQALAAYGLHGGGDLETRTELNYVLLVLLLPVALFGAYFQLESRRGYRQLTAGLIGAWALLMAIDNARVDRQYIVSPPDNAHRVLADYLISHRIKYRNDWLLGQLSRHVFIEGTRHPRIRRYRAYSGLSDARRPQSRECRTDRADAVQRGGTGRRMVRDRSLAPLTISDNSNICPGGATVATRELIARDTTAHEFADVVRLAVSYTDAGSFSAVANGSAAVPPLPAPPEPTVHNLSGFINDFDSRLPIVNARVEVLNGSNAGKVATTDAAGAYLLTDLTPATFRMRASADGYDAGEQNVTVPDTSRADMLLRRSAPATCCVCRNTIGRRYVAIRGRTVHVVGDARVGHLRLAGDVECRLDVGGHTNRNGQRRTGSELPAERYFRRPDRIDHRSMDHWPNGNLRQPTAGASVLPRRHADSWRAEHDFGRGHRWSLYGSDRARAWHPARRLRWLDGVGIGGDCVCRLDVGP